MNRSKALLLSNGPLSDPAWVRSQLTRNRSKWLVVAADGGFVHGATLGITVDVRIGDFDSATSTNDPQGHGPRELRFKRDKDETDLELALAHVVSFPSIRELVLVGGMGRRLDHGLTNLNLMARYAGKGYRVSLLDGDCRLRFVDSSLLVESDVRFDTVSLVPYSPRVTGVQTEGLVYPLRGETLYRDRGRGVSNRFKGSRARIRVGSGLLMVMEVRQDLGPTLPEALDGAPVPKQGKSRNRFSSSTGYR